MSRNKRRYPRINIELPAQAVMQQVYPPIDVDVPVKIYQLGAAGCAIETKEKYFVRGDGFYLNIKFEAQQTPIQLCTTVVWASRGNEQPFLYGLRFLWIRKRPLEDMDDPVTERINEILKPTGFVLLPKA